MKTILCLTDYTPSSKIALGIALRFAERLNYKIILVHVEPIDRMEFQEDSSSKLSKFLDETIKNQSGKSNTLIENELVYG
ncbi:MAG: universal stress protein, partial [Bacteroidota bacterium]